MHHSPPETRTSSGSIKPLKFVFFANTEWYLYNFRRSLALALKAAGHEVILVSPPGAYGQRLRELGFRWEAAPMERRSLNMFREAHLINWLGRLFRRERVSLVHGFTIKSAIYGSLAAKLAGVPAQVSAVAGLGYVFSSDDPRAKLLRPVVRCLARLTLGGRNARLILQNADDVDLFQEHRLVSPGAIRLIPSSGVDCGRFVPDKQDRAPLPSEQSGRSRGRSKKADVLRVVLPARLLWEKGVGEFAEASKLLRAEGRGVCFLLAGNPDPGNPGAVPVPILERWEREGLVKRLGHVDDMAALFRSVDVAVLPSYYREGVPRGLIEAGACGLPLVTTDAPGCRDVVDDGVNGFLVPMKDAASLAHAIARLQDDPDLRKRMGRASREKVVAEFDERIVIERTMAVYQELLPNFVGYTQNVGSGNPTYPR
jgi:glycosyltransferase involved in cell wall biosynthesis